MNQPTIAVLPPEKMLVGSETAELNNHSYNLQSYIDEKNECIPANTSNDEAIAKALSTSMSTNEGNIDLGSYRVATASNPWQYDSMQFECFQCGDAFSPLNRRHHCRLCGHIFCNKCSDLKALIPPSRIVLHPPGGKKAKPRPVAAETASFSPDPDPDRMLTYYNNTSTNVTGDMNSELLYGKGLEERFQLAREPLRVCLPCHTQLQSMQEELRRHNSHCMRFNHIDPTNPRRLFNSPLAFSLGHEIRKAAYTLNNLLPQPKRSGVLIQDPYFANDRNLIQSEVQQCKEQCSAVSPNLGDLDGVRIPARLLEQAKGVAVLTVVKGGFGFAGVEFGTGLVVARTAPGRWSAPSAIGTAGLAWGALVGAQLSDHVFLLMTDEAVSSMFRDQASVQLGADIGVSVGPLGRSLEGDWNVGQGNVAPIYTYSLSKGLYAGASLDGKILVTRHDVNEKFYGGSVSAQTILAGAVPTPPAAQPLYEALQRCHVYVSNISSCTIPESATLRSEYGEITSVANVSDITDF